MSDFWSARCAVCEMLQHLYESIQTKPSKSYAAEEDFSLQGSENVQQTEMAISSTSS
jgi:hypothetical protein